MAPRNFEDHDIEIEVDSVKYRASYYVAHGWVHVSSGIGSKNAALNRSDAERLARILLRELVHAKVRE